ncbi:VTC domain-containing protein [Aeromicrobium terrae]|uniref:VTC domain-containing protein n=1 Tax=Aeromicrobium terrae TaxID=2498846 RepID=UPI00164F4FD9|nr:VTC domain-containing protein [Aeromicrobium terrae]
MTLDLIVDRTDGLDAFDSVSLAETVDRADLSHRVDRKYLVPLGTVRDALPELATTHRVLEVAGRFSTTYSTTYFDTHDLASCRAHIQGRRRRWKVRSRLYVEDGLCRVEVKTRSSRGRTVKAVAPSESGRHGHLSGADREFVARTLEPDHPELDVDALRPTAEITYERSCLVDVDAGRRLTIDHRLSSVLAHGRAWVDDGFAVVETKGGAVPSEADRLLVRLGARPRSFSKYVATASLLYPDLADNDVRALRGWCLHCAPRDTDQEGRP